MAVRIYVNDENNHVSSIEELENKYDKKYLDLKFFYYKCEECGKIKEKRYTVYSSQNYSKESTNCICRECKHKKTMKERYGSMRYCIDKSRESMMKKYGSTSTAQFIDYSKINQKARVEKYKETCIEKYGVDNPAKAQVVKDKAVKTNLQRYGETYACKLPEMRKKLSEIAKARPEFKSAAISHETHLANRLAEVEEKQLEWLDSDKFRGRYNKQTGKINYYSFKCKKCGLEFEDSFATFKSNYSPPYCRSCNPPLARSLKEDEISNSIKSYYDGLILENGRKVLKGKHTELDVYLPDLKLAIEFNGTFWHGYTKYSYEDGIDLEEFKVDFLSKKDECESLGVRLITIPEPLYNEKKNAILNYLKTEIAGNILEKYEIKEVDYQQVSEFIEVYSVKNILQNNISKLFGVYSNNELYSAVIFEKDEVLGNVCSICRSVKLDEDKLLNKIANKYFLEKFFHKIDLHFNNGERKIEPDYYLYYNGSFIEKGEFKTFEEFFKVSRTLIFDFGYDLKEYN